MVIPSWHPAIISDTFSMAPNVILAARDPAAAVGSMMVRRAEMRANSAPTKKALKSSRNTVSPMPQALLMTCLSKL